MRVLRSLTNRIFLATALMAILSIGLAIFVVNGAVTRQAEQQLTRGLESAAALVDQDRDLLVEQLAREALLLADLPKLKAAVAVDHPPTLAPIAGDYQRQLGSDLFLVTDATGIVLANSHDRRAIGRPVRDLAPIRRALAGRASIAFWPGDGQGTQVVTVPIWIDESRPELLGTLSIGFDVDHRLASRFKTLTDSEVAFVVDDAVRATTLPAVELGALEGLADDHGHRRVRLADQDYLAISRTLSMGTERAATLGAVIDATNAPRVVILRSRTEQLAFLRSLQAALVGTGLLGVLVATLLSYAVARTVTRPVGAIITTMREMTATGDLTPRITLPDQGRWTDDDTRLLAGTFNAMTDSIATFQREAAQRERLSSLGRLSTVVAHEIRNPLMIIKAALRTLRRQPGLPSAARQATADIDEEVGRLNRIVGEVLDFARPIAFEPGRTSLNALCAEAAEAVTAGPAVPAIATRLDPDADQVVTDRERLRLALVNVLTNARDAVRRATGTRPARVAGAPPAIELSTDSLGDARVVVAVRDRGVGIAAADLPKVFDPYFTTRRTGSGLGLAIAKNIVEGLGGTIAVTSEVGEGTLLRIELPRRTNGPVG